MEWKWTRYLVLVFDENMLCGKITLIRPHQGRPLGTRGPTGCHTCHRTPCTRPQILAPAKLFKVGAGGGSRDNWIYQDMDACWFCMVIKWKLWNGNGKEFKNRMFEVHLGERILVNWVLECRPGGVVLVLLLAFENTLSSWHIFEHSKVF